MASINGRPQATGYDQPATVLQNAAAAAANGVHYPVDANTEELLFVVAGASTPSLTGAIEYSQDNAATWKAAYAQDAVNVALAYLTTVAIASADQRYRYKPLPGSTHVRFRISAQVTGNATVTVYERRKG